MPRLDGLQHGLVSTRADTKPLATLSVHVGGPPQSIHELLYTRSIRVHIFVVVLNLKQKFAFSARSIGFCFLLVPAGILPTVILLPHLTRRFGLHACITTGCLANVLLCALLSIPDLHSRSVVLILGLSFAMFFTFTQHNANQARAKMIAAKYAKNATGAVTGVSRTCFALGQAIGPLVSGLIWSWSVSGPFLVLAAIQLSQIVLMMVTFVLCRIQA